MITYEQHILPIAARSLCWWRDGLIDWVRGGHVYRFDGSDSGTLYHYAYRFDAAITSPSGRFSVLYEKRGTKGLVLDERGRVLREINRSFYYANAYEYPVALFALPDGTEVLAHCPEEYNELVLEDAGTGQRLSAPHATIDFFHSRLQADPTGRWLARAGGIGHPLDAICLYRIEKEGNGWTLTQDQDFLQHSDEVESAAFAGPNRLILALRVEDGAVDVEPDPEEPNRLLNPLPEAPASLVVYDLAARQRLTTTPLDEPTGTIMPVGERHVVAFRGSPRLLDLQTGAVVQHWSDLATGQQASSILWHIEAPPPLALDPVGRRFAVAEKERVVVVTLSE